MQKSIGLGCNAALFGANISGGSQSHDDDNETEGAANYYVNDADIVSNSLLRWNHLLHE